ncbi:hypothetical protein CPAV1605_750 [seawater metagenome]|uniref:Acyl-coenzyme A:6-aminopenicillanic acid acyl-transferase n=1 Tax=seawater metagenome TaxID=1561972 RepID=A0A5E8CLL3_9ZZZZ
MNIFFWIVYYIKCGLNIAFSYVLNFFRKVENTVPKTKASKTKIHDHLYLVKLSGTYYNMGVKYGEMMKDIIHNDTAKILKFITDNQDIFLKKVNPIIKNEMKTNDILEAIYIMYTRCVYFIPDEINDYYKGVAKGSQIEFKKIIQTNFFFELMESHCILYTNKSKKGFLCLRTLDYGCPVLTQNIVVFAPEKKNKYLMLGHCFGLAAAFTMVSEKGLVLGESYYDYNLGKDPRKGIPFYILFHKICAEANNLKEAESILEKAKRMGNLHLAISSIKEEKAKIYKYSYSNLETDLEINENQKKNVIYSVTPNEKRRFEKYKDKFTTAEEAISNMLPMVKSGEVHTMIYFNNYIYVSVTSTYIQSYNNNFCKLKIEDLFKD